MAKVDFTGLSPAEVIVALDAILVEYGKSGDKVPLLSACEQGRFAMWRFEDEGLTPDATKDVRKKIAEVAKLALAPGETWGIYHESDEDHQHPYDDTTYPNAAKAEEARAALVASGVDMDGYVIDRIA